MASKIIQIEKKLVKNSNKELVFSNTYTEQNIINMLFLLFYTVHVVLTWSMYPLSDVSTIDLSS